MQIAIFVMHLFGKITDWIEKKVLWGGERRDKRRLTDEGFSNGKKWRKKAIGWEIGQEGWKRWGGGVGGGGGGGGVGGGREVWTLEVSVGGWW